VFVWAKDVSSKADMQESSFWEMLTDSGSRCYSYAGCVEPVAKGIVVVGGEREDAAYFGKRWLRGAAGGSWLWPRI
jgi:hypothetical protein